MCFLPQMDAYSEAMDELKELQKKEKVDVTKSFTFYLSSGAIMRHCVGSSTRRYVLEDRMASLIQRKWVQKRALKAQEAQKRKDKAAPDAKARIADLQKQLAELAELVAAESR